jgi:hypothetical protein
VLSLIEDGLLEGLDIPLDRGSPRASDVLGAWCAAGAQYFVPFGSFGFAGFVCLKEDEKTRRRKSAFASGELVFMHRFTGT